MALSLEIQQKILLRIAEAQKEKNVDGGYNGVLRKTLDLNLPPANLGTISLHTIGMVGSDTEIKARCHVKDNKRTCDLGLVMNSNIKDSNGDFIQKLSSNTKEAFNNSISSSSPSLQPRMFMKKNIDDALNGVTNLENVPKFECMGCVHCHMYIMVNESEPRCPKCKSIDLLDFSAVLNYPIKKARRN